MKSSALRFWCSLRPYSTLLVSAALACGGGSSGGSSDGADATSGESDGLSSDDITFDYDIDANDVVETPDGLDSDLGEDAPPTCPPATCGKIGSALCKGAFSYTVCLADDQGCPYASQEIPCSNAQQCAAGSCFGGCVAPKVVLVVDRSAAMKGANFGDAFLGLKRALLRVAGGVDFGLVVAPANDPACGLQADSIAPAKDQASAIVSTLETVGTGPVETATALPVATSLDEAATLLGPPAEGQMVIFLTASKTACEGDSDVADALRRFRERDTRVHVLWLGGAEVPALPAALADGGGTKSPRVTLDDASVTQALVDILATAGTCCYDPDGDERGEFCDKGPDCNQADAGVAVPSCVDKECGDDGCGNSCGKCPAIDNGTSTCTENQCVEVCDDGFHACGGGCVAKQDVNHCGDSCEPCFVPVGGQATCDGLTCGTTCPDGTHLCGETCVASDSPDHCGDSCEPCATAPGATPTCEAGQCGLACEVGFLACDAGCAKCPTASIQTTACAGDQCVAATCAPGFVLTGGICADRLIEILDTDVPTVTQPSADAAYPGTVVAAWQHTGASPELRVAIGTPGSLVVETIDAAAGTALTSYPRVSLDLLDKVHVAYVGGTNASSAEIVASTRTDAGVWSTTTLVNTFAPIGYQGGDFAFFASPSALYAAYPGPDQLGLAKSNTLSSTQSLIANAANTSYNDTPAIAVDAAGIAHVLVVEDANTVALYAGSGTTFSRQFVDTVSNVGPHRLDLALRSDDVVGLCWLDNTILGDRGVMFAEDLQGTVKKEPVDIDGEQSCDVAYDKSDAPYIAYKTAKGAVRLAKRTAAAWSHLDVATPSSPGFQLRWPSLAVHSTGGRSVVYWDGPAASVVHVYFPPEP